MTYMTATKHTQAEQIAAAALVFTEARQAALPAAIIRHLWLNGDATAVVEALALYQNEDGGFGNRLEPDIESPASNPFAARIAMQVLSALPADAGGEIRQGLRRWLVENQHPDGDWHFSDATKAGGMQPWFAAWTFPALNPACCVAGYANALGLATDEMMARVAALFAEKASLEQVRDGGFYDILPYVEYSLGAPLPHTYTDAIATRILTTAGNGGFDDAEHFFTLAVGGSAEITRQIPDAAVFAWIDRLLLEPLEDGGWPTPYDDAWRPWTTANNLMTLARLR